METILNLFESFGFVNVSTEKKRLLFTDDRSSIEIIEDETVFIEDSKIIRVPTSDLNAIAFLAYILTPKDSRVNIHEINNAEYLLNLVKKDNLSEAEIVYNDKLLEVFIKYQLLNRRSRLDEF